ncbi:hypothetical protein LWI29_006751 [Acer saccharum]|uniref:Mediator complex subunit 15 KIX domain-containing protein n=1 Tax=Acer saccharum TaxID=4024 RepID=A0AA39VX04_ACESA|nr:hypothetical protein LWI29_006751 [Acer saccharum]
MGRRNDVIVLDRLQFLCLKNLPKLRRFCSEAEVASSSDQEKQMLDTPMPFFDGKPTSPLGESSMDADDWRNQLLHHSRQENVMWIMYEEDKVYPQHGFESNISFAAAVEQRIYTTSSNQSDYNSNISLQLERIRMEPDR